MVHNSSLKIANQLLQAGKLDDARKEYQTLIELRPNFPWNYYYLAQLFVEKNKWSDAIVQYKQAIKLNPNSANLHNSLAEALIKQGELDEAINSSKKAISLEPNLAIYHQTLALAYEAKSDFGQALTTWQKVLSFNPNHLRATQKISWLQTDVARDYAERGKKLNEEGKIKEAVESYQQALILNLQQPMSVYLNYGNNLMTLGRLKEAETVFQQLKELYPERPDGYKRLAKLTHFLEDWELALKRWSEAIVKFPENIGFQTHKGNVLINLSRFDEAEAVFQQLIEKYPNQPFGYEGYARLSHSLDNSESALKIWSKATVKFPENMDFQVEKGNLLIKLSRFDEADAVFQQLIEKHPELPSIYERYATVANCLADWELALERWENAITKLPDDFNCYLQKGDVLTNLFRYEEAETWWEKVIAQYPDRHEGLSKSAALARHLGNNKLAWKRFEQIIEKFPGHIRAYSEAARELISMGRFAEAEERFLLALQRNPNDLTALLQGGILASQQASRELALERFERIIEYYPPQKAIDAYILAATELKYLGREGEAIAKYEQILSFHQQRGLYPEVKLLGRALTSFQELGLLLDRLTIKQPERMEEVISLTRLTHRTLFNPKFFRPSNYASIAKDAPSLLPKLKILKELLSQCLIGGNNRDEKDLSLVLSHFDRDEKDLSLVLNHFNLAIQVLEKESQLLNNSEWERFKLVRSAIPVLSINKFSFEGLSSSARYVMGADERMPKSQLQARIKYSPELTDEEKKHFAANVQKFSGSLKLSCRQTIGVYKDFICNPPFGVSERYIFNYSPKISEQFVKKFINENTSNSSSEMIPAGEIASRMIGIRRTLDEIAIRKTTLNNYYKDDVIFGLPILGYVWGSYQNYGHLLFDQITSLILYQKLNLSCKIFVPHITDSHWEIFGHLNIPKEKILVKQEQKFKYFIYGNYRYDAEMINFYRKLRDSIVAKRGDIPSEYRARYVYLSRRYSERRAMVNEVEVEELMASLGFSIIYGERLTFEEKAMLMHHTSVFVSPIGAGMSCILMCHPNTTIVEIFSDLYIEDRHFYSASVLGECNFYPLYCHKTLNGLEMNIDKLKKVITTILEGQ
ncbi:tetratricopeptide repeat protein [Okeania sp. SIO3B5]|uniref:tetratricopeptide repeat protein n=1 Tax=Okeania sp. SIO3B5 TaxID=2607811 RepID=UPI0025F7D257|nr:tetratricopeptide repeat protein [Okeania sp. SIO3B5]